MKSYPPEVRQQALVALEASAAAKSKGGKEADPVWNAVSRQTGVTRSTLQRWWKQRHTWKPSATRSASVVPFEVHNREDAPADPLDPSDPLNPLTLEPLEYYTHAFQRDVDAYGEALAAGQLQAARGFADRQDASYEKVRAELLEQKAKGKNLTREEAVQRLRQTIERMAPADAVVVAEVLRERGIAS